MKYSFFKEITSLGGFVRTQLNKDKYLLGVDK